MNSNRLPHLLSLEKKQKKIKILVPFFLIRSTTFPSYRFATLLIGFLLIIKKI